jgi:uncharacterized integral membrane protein
MSSAPAQTPGPSQPKSDRKANRRRRREQTRTGALVVLGILITLFAVFNVKDVKVNWIFGTGNAPLIIVIVISLLVGIVLTHFVERYTGKHHKHG